MPSYLSDKKSELKALFDDAFQQAWEELIEPSIKESYRNGLEDAWSGKVKRPSTPAGDGKKSRRRFGNRQSTHPQTQEE